MTVEGMSCGVDRAIVDGLLYGILYWYFGEKIMICSLASNPSPASRVPMGSD
jgi:hypothetical protein